MRLGPRNPARLHISTDPPDTFLMRSSFGFTMGAALLPADAEAPLVEASGMSTLTVDLRYSCWVVDRMLFTNQ